MLKKPSLQQVINMLMFWKAGLLFSEIGARPAGLTLGISCLSPVSALQALNFYLLKVISVRKAFKEHCKDETNSDWSHICLCGMMLKLLGSLLALSPLQWSDNLSEIPLRWWNMFFRFIKEKMEQEGPRNFGQSICVHQPQAQGFSGNFTRPHWLQRLPDDSVEFCFHNPDSAPVYDLATTWVELFPDFCL